MQCNKPFVLKSKSGLRREIPCGSCVGCKIARAREWATRCVHEAAYWPYSGFVTLTYRDEDLPADCGLDIDEFTKFWKRLRKALGDRKIRYFGCGEYGEKNGRPHYHAIIFGIKACSCGERSRPDNYCGCEDRDAIMRSWGHGGVSRIGSVSYLSARYCADYIGKGSDLKLTCLQNPFKVISRGIGKRYAEDHIEELKKQKAITIQGVPVGTPRYYMSKIKDEGRRLSKESSSLPWRVRHAWVGELPAMVAVLEENRNSREAIQEAKQNLVKKERMK